MQRNSHSAKTVDFRDQSTLTSTVVDQFVAVIMHLQAEAVTITQHEVAYCFAKCAQPRPLAQQ